MAGEEVDLLVTGLEEGAAHVQWGILRFWLMHRLKHAAAGAQPAEVEEILDDTMQTVIEAMLKRSFLLRGSTPQSRRYLAANAPPPFSHVSIFRAWATVILKNEAFDRARERKREQRKRERLFADAPELVGTNDEEVEDLADRVNLTWLDLPDLAALVDGDHRKAPGQRGWMRAQHMRHTLARLPHRRVAETAARFPALGLDKLPVAQNDIEMARNLTDELSRAGLDKPPKVTQHNVHSTRANYRVHIQAHHPALSAVLALVLLVALGQVDLQNWLPDETDQSD
jgi:hypothetical protein